MSDKEFIFASKRELLGAITTLIELHSVTLGGLQTVARDL